MSVNQVTPTVESIIASLTLNYDGSGNWSTTDDDNGWTVRVELSPADRSWEDIEDPEAFGRVECVYRNSLGSDRPKGFDGSAIKLHLGNNHPTRYDIWFMPPRDFRRFKGSGFETIDKWREAADAHRSYVIDVLGYGYSVLTVTVSHKVNGYTRCESASLGGIEPFPDRRYLMDLVPGLLSDALSTFGGEP